MKRNTRHPILSSCVGLLIAAGLLAGCSQPANEAKNAVEAPPVEAPIADTPTEGTPNVEAPNEAVQDQTVEIQGELLDAPLPAAQGVASGTGSGDAESASGFPINETAQQALDSIIGSVPPPANMEAYLNRPPISATAELAKATTDAKGYRRIPFDILSSYEYMIPTLVVDKETEEQLKNQIPEYVKSLDDTKVSIEGYMVPLDIKDEKVKSFILTNSMMLCCFGAMPWINEWIYVEMEGESTADFFNDTVIRVSGVLDVGEEIEDGIVLSLYRMDGQSVESEGKPLSYLFEGYGEY